MRWSFDAHPELGFRGDNCIDLGISTLHVTLADDYESWVDEMVPCLDGSYTMSGLIAGVGYSGLLTPLDAHGAPLVWSGLPLYITTGVSSDPPPVFDENIDWNRWSGPLTGDFAFQASWNGSGCAGVATQALLLTVNGQPVAATTDTGQRVDGNDDRPCRDPSDAQHVANVPVGPGQITLIGKDSSGAVLYQQSFATFVGAGPNPAFSFDVGMN